MRPPAPGHTQAVSQFGLTILLTVRDIGRFTMFAAATIRRLLTRLDRGCRWRLQGPQFFAVGESKPEAGVDPAQLAAYTMIANQLFNLDEVLNK